ncbi:sulfite exporter TauE/SafE family protein [Candidatus Protochlamydia phocaeensis]|uniref:sulfite exporter TauE/SafE family protein n=1 Tax=Candidatus Protochlamydia phocaeensis TaxID=1414722 RepID=UPI0008398ABB|nr:sulfite exporter TauE/SafE family protein [Candidatus Protochlamydia phocaeensis]
MTLFFTLLPLYLFGNVHCLGMCGPLVMMLGQHRYRAFYFIGRLLSFSLAGLLAGEAGAVVQLFLKHYHLAETISFLCGLLIILWGVSLLLNWKTGLMQKIMQWKLLAYFNQRLSALLLKDTGWSTFLFGFFTLALPCGQTIVVFSACALVGNALVGLFNGFAFALLTTPSLVLAMHASTFLKRLKNYTNTVLGLSTIFVGALACCRGLAEMGWISHWILNPDSSTLYHIVIF